MLCVLVIPSWAMSLPAVRPHAAAVRARPAAATSAAAVRVASGRSASGFMQSMIAPRYNSHASRR
jgi:hypothetical protein